MAHHHFAERPSEQVLLCAEMMAEARRNPEIARISAAFDADVRKWLVDLLRAAAERGDIPGDVDFDGVVTMLMIIADGVWWRRALDPDFDAEAVLPMFMDITRHMLRGRSAKRARPKSASHASGRQQGELPMKASRITAVGLVAAAGLWIASGHFLPHEIGGKPRRRAPGESEAKKLFRVAVDRRRRRAAQPQARCRRPHRGRQARSSSPRAPAAS